MAKSDISFSRIPLSANSGRSSFSSLSIFISFIIFESFVSFEVFVCFDSFEVFVCFVFFELFDSLDLFSFEFIFESSFFDDLVLDLLCDEDLSLLLILDISIESVSLISDVYSDIFYFLLLNICL